MTTPFSAICERCGGFIPLLAQPPAFVTCPACGRAYDASGGILRFSGASEPTDYAELHYSLLTAVEDRHPWFRARTRALFHILRDIGPLAGRTAVDVGCGTGLVMAALERAGMRTCGLDMNVAGLQIARTRVRGALVRAAANEIPVRGPVDLAVLCDVIEHVDDDVALLGASAGIVGPGGHVIVTVPADPRLWSAVDEASGHKRRYRAKDLGRALAATGLTVLTVRYFNAWLWPALVARRVRWKSGTVSGPTAGELIGRNLRPPPAALGIVIDLLSRLETSGGRLALPLGTSLVGLARRARA